MDEAGTKLLRGLLEVFLLESLEREPKHGYAILREMGDSFGVEPNRNRLYPLLGRLVKEGLVHEVTGESSGRTLYRLTAEGHAALAAYKSLPDPFRDTLTRLWGADASTNIEGAPAAPAPPRATSAPQPAAPAPTPQPRRTIPVLSMPDVRMEPMPTTLSGEAPYPCPDARLGLTKDARTGDLSIRLAGCPMGAYDYCPQCPIFKAVEGIRRLVFSL